MIRFSFRRSAAVTLCLLFCAASAEARPRWPRRGSHRSEDGKYTGIERRSRWASRGWLRSVDWKFAGAVLAQFAMVNLDAYSGLRCFHRFSLCSEQNPLFGSHPSSARVYTQMNLYIVGLAVAQLYFKDSMRRDKGKSFLWLVGPAASVPVNLTATLGNFHIYDKYSAQCRASGKLVC